MGCDIHTLAQRLVDNQWVDLEYEPFDETGRDYRLFSFLAGVRDRIGITPISEPRGLPEGIDLWGMTNGILGDEEWGFWHSHSYLTLKELIEFDYDKPLLIKGKVITVKEFKELPQGYLESDVDLDSILTYRMFLSSTCLFEELDKLKELKVDRILFAFDI